MAKQWSLIKDGAIVKTITNGISGGKRNLVGGRSSANHTDELLTANDYLPHIATSLKQYENYNYPEVYIIHDNYIDHKITPWTQDMIDVELLRIANEELLILKQGSDGLAYWVNKTEQDIIDLVASTPSTFAGFRYNDEKLALAIADIVQIMKLWRDLGRIV